MPDRLRDIITRLSGDTGQDLVSMYDNSLTGSKQEKPKTEPISETREQLPNRQTKRAFDKALKNQSPKNRTREAKRNRARDSRRIEKLRRQFLKKFGKDVIPKVIPSYLWIQTKDIIQDTTGGAVELYAHYCEHKIAVTLIKRAALAPDALGVNKYSFAGADRGAVRARSIMALGLLMVGLSSRTGRRKDRYNRIVKGVSQSQLLAAITHPAKKDESPHPNTLIGTHRHDENHTCVDGSVGYLRALKNVGFCYSRQARWHDGAKPSIRGWEDIQQNEISPVETQSGWRVSLCRYWIVTDRHLDPVSAATRAELWIAWLAGQLPEPPTEELTPPFESSKIRPGYSPIPPS